VCECVNWWQVEPSRKKDRAPRVDDCIKKSLLHTKKEEENRQQISRFCSPEGLSWMEYFSFTFLLMAVQTQFNSLPGLGYSSFPTETLCIFRTTFPLKQKGYYPEKDLNFMIFKSENFSCRSFLAGFHSKFALATSLGVLGSDPEHSLLQRATPLIIHISLASL